MQEILKKNSYKLTKARLALLKLLETDHRPVNAKQIYIKLNKKYNLVSIYRNLALFTKIKIIEQDILHNEKYYFISKKHHHHISCIKCGRIQCVSCKKLNFKIKNFKNINHELILTGVCNKCL